MALKDEFSGLQVDGVREDGCRDGGQEEEDAAGCGDGGVVGSKVRTAQHSLGVAGAPTVV